MFNFVFSMRLTVICGGIKIHSHSKKVNAEKINICFHSARHGCFLYDEHSVWTKQKPFYLK